jgi:hypothetical protein
MTVTAIYRRLLWLYPFDGSFQRRWSISSRRGRATGLRTDDFQHLFLF